MRNHPRCWQASDLSARRDKIISIGPAIADWCAQLGPEPSWALEVLGNLLALQCGKAST